MLPPSPWVTRWAALLPPGGAVLDVAAGSGRHSRFLLAGGHRVTAVDIDISRLADLANEPLARLRQADLENAPWPFPAERFAGVVVTNYLWRPLLPALLASVAPGGALIYETFALGQERFGKPSKPEFLLRPGELLDWVRGGFEVRAYEHGEDPGPQPAMRQRIAAVRTVATA
jgi:SAM-dependent methyltransferase